MKKLNLRGLVLLALLAGTLMLTAASVSAASIKAGDSRVTTSRLNLRTEATTGSSVITVIPKGAFVEIASSAPGGWYKVIYSSRLGYVSGAYLTDPFTMFGDKYTKYVVTAIRMRSTPKQTAANKMGVIPTGGKVFVIAKVSGADWYKVYYGGKVGYIIGGYFRGDSTNTRRMAKNIYLRKTPTQNSSNIICVIKAGKQVVLLSKYNSKWYKVRFGTKIGYIMSGYFTNDPSANVTRKLTTNVNLRSSRSTASSANILRVIPKGASVKVLKSYSDNWYRVTYSGTTGYIKGGYFA